MASSKAMPVDLELKKAFQDLQKKMVSTSQQLKVSDMQVDQLKKQITHSKIIDKELEILPNNINTYKSVGRMFLKMSVQDIRDDLKGSADKNEAKIKTIESNKVYLERTLKEHEGNLRELVSNKQKEQAR